MADYSYLGSGRTYLREIGATAGLIEVGNCSALSFAVSEDTKELKDYTQPGGGTYNEVKRISSVEASLTMHDLSPTNLARATYGTTSAVVSAPVADEAHTVSGPGEFIPTTFLPSAIGAVKEGTTTLTEGIDYEARPSGIVALAGGALAAGNTVLISYTKAGADVVQALVNSGKEYEMVFDGLNEARSGKRTRVTAYRMKIGAAANLGLIGDDYAALEVTGKLLKDVSKTGVGISQYFKVEIEQ